MTGQDQSWLKRKVTARGKTQVWLADQLGIDKSTLHERLGKPDRLTLGNRDVMGEVLGVCASWFHAGLEDACEGLNVDKQEDV